MCLFALAAVPQLALGQSAGDDQYADPFAGQDSQSAPNSSQDDSEPAAAQPDTQTQAPATTSAPAGQTSSGSGSSSSLAYTGFPAGLAALLGAIALAAGLMLRMAAGRPPAPRRDAVLVLGRDLRLQPRARR